MQNISLPTTGTLTGAAAVASINSGFTSLQQAIGGYLPKSVAGGVDVTLSAAEVNYGIIQLTGAISANINVIVPASSMEWKFQNSTSGGFSITVKTPAGTGIVVLQGSNVILFCDGTNVLQLTVPTQVSRKNLMSVLVADYLGGWYRDVLKGGRDNAFRNQQWGGGIAPFELVDGATGTQYRFESATNSIEDNTFQSVASAAGNTHAFMQLQVGATQSISAIWVKIYKSGNPANNLQLRILPSSGAIPSSNTPITNGTATAQSGKLHTSKTDGEWVRFVFATPCALTAGTLYAIDLSSSGAVDATNFWNWKLSNRLAKIYPFGQNGIGDATPTFSTGNAQQCFIVEAAAASQTLQAGGIFGLGKIVFNQGSPLVQSNVLTGDARNGWDGEEGTWLFTGATWPASTPFYELQYGLDHSRIAFSINASGFVVVTVYKEALPAVAPLVVTGTTDVRTGNHQVVIHIRAKGDGADKIELITDTVVATPLTGQTIVFDIGLLTLGTEWTGGGFVAAPTWSGSSISSFTGLPSTLGWTFGGIATEANAFSVSGGKLNQNKGGYTALQDGYYKKTTAGLSNANGVSLLAKSRTSSSSNIKHGGLASDVLIGYEDGTKQIYINPQEYFLDIGATAGTPDYMYQADYKGIENVLHLSAKGSDYFVFSNGRLVNDGSTKYTVASANNQLWFGDTSVTSGENADVVYSYAKYYSTNNLVPVIATGWQLSEFAALSGDMTSLASTFYSGGTFKSLRDVCGIERGYVGESKVGKQARTGITVNPTTASGSPLNPLQEMDCWVVGEEITYAASSQCSNNTVNGYSFINGIINGVAEINASAGFVSATANAFGTPAVKNTQKKYFGLHKVSVGGYASTTSTTTFSSTVRNLTVEARTL